MRFAVTHDGEAIGRSDTLEGALALGHTVGSFVVADNEDDRIGNVKAPWKAASCDGRTLIVNHPGGGQAITHLGEN